MASLSRTDRSAAPRRRLMTGHNGADYWNSGRLPDSRGVVSSSVSAANDRLSQAKAWTGAQQRPPWGPTEDRQLDRRARQNCWCHIIYSNTHTHIGPVCVIKIICFLMIKPFWLLGLHCAPAAGHPRTTGEQRFRFLSWPTVTLCSLQLQPGFGQVCDTGPWWSEPPG